MYCIHCGVRLSDTETVCPLCNTVVPCPQPETAPLYPIQQRPSRQMDPHTAQFAAAAACLLAMIVCVLCDLQVDHTIGWSRFALGALAVGYVCLLLPMWFSRPNPVIFVPCGFAAAGVYLLFVDLWVGSGWFLPFALPVACTCCIIVTTAVTLLRYVRGGKLYIFGGAFIAIGGFFPVMELLMDHTFQVEDFLGWSFYPLAALVLLGGMLIFLAIYTPARETMERKFFL